MAEAFYWQPSCTDVIAYGVSNAAKLDDVGVDSSCCCLWSTERYLESLRCLSDPWPTRPASRDLHASTVVIATKQPDY